MLGCGIREKKGFPKGLSAKFVAMGYNYSVPCNNWPLECPTTKIETFPTRHGYTTAVLAYYVGPHHEHLCTRCYRLEKQKDLEKAKGYTKCDGGVTYFRHFLGPG